MTISSIGYGNTPLGRSVQNINDQLTDLTAQLSSGKKSTTYAGMGVNEGFAIAARAQISNLSAYATTATNVTTTINVANTALQSFSDIAQQIQNATSSSSQTLDSNGQTIAQQTSLSEFSAMVGILNTQAGDRYIFSGSAINTPAVANADTILNGNGTQAGLKQVISERQQADLGSTGDVGRVIVSTPAATPPALATVVSVAEDVAGSPFGLKPSSISSSLTGATVTQPPAQPAPPAAPVLQTMSVDLVSNPNNGDQISFTFNLPDGTSESIQLTASSATPTPSGSFAIGATPDVTAANLNTALSSSISTLANTSLVAASAVVASNNFFGSPPMRVTAPASPATLATATSLTAGTSANTVSWYTGAGAAGSTSARASSTARIDDSVTVQYGAQANEDAIRTQLQNVAMLAATSESASDPNLSAKIVALNQRATANFSTTPGQQSIQDMQSDFASALSTVQNTTARQTQQQSTLQTMVDSTEGISSDQVASQILALQTQLQASYQTTSMLSQLSLVKYLPIGG